MEYFFSRRELIGSPPRTTTRPSVTTNFIEMKNVLPTISPANVISSTVWAKRVLATSASGKVLIVVHGFNVLPNSFMSDVAAIRKRLFAAGYKGAVVGYDWPSDGRTLHYGKDWSDAEDTAESLVFDGIAALVRASALVKVGILAHSMGCFVTAKAIANALNDSSRRHLTRHIDQVIFTAPDLAVTSVEAGGWVRQLAGFGCKRLTGFVSDRDLVLEFSRDFRRPPSKRFGRTLPRSAASSHFVAVDCSDYYTRRNRFSKPRHSHSWYYKDKNFFFDFLQTLQGRTPKDTRRRGVAGHFKFRSPRN